jgi:hypothetical protein
VADGVGIAPTQPGGSLGFRDRGITALPTIRNGQGGRSCTCGPSVPSRVRWLLRYALENGGSEGVRTLSLPADNGLLR